MRIRLGPVAVTIGKAAEQSLITTWPSPNGWWPVIRESFSGAWQRNVTVPVQDVLCHSTAWSCITLIASDIAKCELDLVQEDTNGIYVDVSNPAFSPVLRKPNHYQNRIQFVMSWIISKLTRGNAYILKERDNRNVVTALYVLDPTRVQVMVSPEGDVFYAISQDVLSGITEASLIVPAREIIHDIMIPLYSPLVGVSPIHACGRAAMQGLKILQSSEEFFENGSQPSGVLTAPTTISDETAKRIMQHWDENFAGARNRGRVVALGDGLKYEQMSMTAVDAQLIDQLKWGDERVCSAFHVPPYMVGVGPLPNYNNIEAQQQQYYSQCLQVLVESLELCLEEGLKIEAPMGVEVDLDNLLRMDSATKMKTATDGVKGGILTPNDGRLMHNKPPLKGGDTVYLQDQDHSIEWLAERDQNVPAVPAPVAPAPQPPMPVPVKADVALEDLDVLAEMLMRKAAA